MFTKEENKIFAIPSFKEDNIFATLESGLYNLKFEQRGMVRVPYFESTGDRFKKGVKIDVGVFKDIREYIDSFLSPEMTQARNEMKMMHKLGLLLHGAPGTGKTYLCCQIAEEMAKKYNAISIMTTEFTDFSVLIDVLRSDDKKDRPIILIIDEFEKGVRRVDTSEILAFLDGTTSRDNIITLATVNDMNELRWYFTERPGRFEKIFEFDMSQKEVSEAIVQALIPKSFKDKLNVNGIIESVIKGNSRDKTIDNIRILVRNNIANYLGLKETKLISTKSLESNSKKVVGFKKQEEEDCDSDEDNKELTQDKPLDFLLSKMKSESLN